VNGEMKSIALVDAVVSNDRFAGSKAIWKTEKYQANRCYQMPSRQYWFLRSSRMPPGNTA